MLHRDNSYACLLEIIIHVVVIYLFKETTKHTHAHTMYA